MSIQTIRRKALAAFLAIALPLAALTPTQAFAAEVARVSPGAEALWAAEEAAAAYSKKTDGIGFVILYSPDRFQDYLQSAKNIEQGFKNRGYSSKAFPVKDAARVDFLGIPCFTGAGLFVDGITFENLRQKAEETISLIKGRRALEKSGHLTH